MAITNASKLASYVGAAITADGASGIITATQFVGDGSGITGIAATADVRTSTLVVSGVSTFNGNITGTAATFTGNVTVGGDINLDDGGTYSTTLQMVTPTANRTISFPDATGTVALVAGSTGQVTYNNAGALAGFNGLTIDGSGNLSGGGVGTTSPAVAWDVVGQVRASTGILFGTDTAAANALDDYEEGTHVTTVTPGTSGTVTLNSTAQTLSYVKIGRFVNVGGYLQVSAVSSPVGYFDISLPFAVANLTQAANTHSVSVHVRRVVSANVADFVGITVEVGSSVRVVLGDGINTSDDSAQELQATSWIYVNASYTTS